MHDDDAPIAPESEEIGRPWTEAQWERFMLENERLMDRYEQVRKDNPDKSWDDPLDLYYKVHYDLDAPEAEMGQAEELAASGESEKDVEEFLEPVETERDDFRQIPAYQLAYAFALAALDYLKRFEHEQPSQQPLRDQFCTRALRIAADIAGGHGLGYEEDVLCGQIVKNRWALGHAQEAQRLLKLLVEQEGSDAHTETLLAKLPPLIEALEERIAQLRTNVWWDK